MPNSFSNNHSFAQKKRGSKKKKTTTKKRTELLHFYILFGIEGFASGSERSGLQSCCGQAHYQDRKRACKKVPRFCLGDLNARKHSRCKSVFVGLLEKEIHSSERLKKV